MRSGLKNKKKKKTPSGLKKKKNMPSYESELVKVNLNIPDSDVESDETLWDLYERWMTHYKVSRTPEEKHKRFVAFKENANYMHFQNKTDNFPYELELNKDSDMTTEEYEIKYTHPGEFHHLDIHDSDLESDETLLDLYERWMTHYNESRSPDEKVKRFAAFKEVVKYVHSENKRDHMAYKLGLNSYSDMSGEEFESKYNGGYALEDTPKAYHKIRQMIDAPLVDNCGYRMVEQEDELAVQLGVYKQPIHALIDSRGDAFRNYRGGVLTEGYGKELLLSVIIIGYRETPAGVKYWTIENSWGETWGDGGFMRMMKGNNFRAIASFASFPTTE